MSEEIKIFIAFHRSRLSKVQLELIEALNQQDVGLTLNALVYQNSTTDKSSKSSSHFTFNNIGAKGELTIQF